MRTRRITPAHIAAACALVLTVAAATWLTGDDSDGTGAADDHPGPMPTTTSPLASTTATTTTATTATTTTTTTTTTFPPGRLELAELIADMSISDKVRQLVATGSGATPDAVVDAVGTLCPGGVFVTWPTRDLPASSTALATIAEITDTAVADGCVGSPLIMTDAEPGTRVLKVPVTPLAPAPELFGRFGDDPADALATLATDGAAFAHELRDLGVHVNFGVPADVDVDSRHYMARRGRSFGDDPVAVAALVDTLTTAHCTAGVAATLKHFPNQGATLEDPHVGRSRSSDSLTQWFARGRLPYEGTSAPMVMTGHIFMEDVDPERPASLSHEITTGLLREGLGYRGVIVTDDLDGMAGATGVVGDRGERAAAAIDAGADMVLFVGVGPHDDIIEALVGEAADDPSFARRIDESAARVLGLKAALGLVDGLDPSWFPLCATTGDPSLLPTGAQPGNSVE